MKQLFTGSIIFCLLTFLGQSTYAQVKVGVKVGLNVAALQAKHINNNTKSILRFNTGLLSEIGLSKNIYLRPELLYSIKGWGNSTTQKESSMNLHYLTLPVLLGYRPIAKLSILAGPEVGYRLRAIQTPAAVFNFNELYQKWDAGLALGVAYMPVSYLGIEIRYIYGVKALSKVMVTDEKGMPAGINSDGYNRALQFGLFYRWGNNK